jgi:hypothetical protein
MRSHFFLENMKLQLISQVFYIFLHEHGQGILYVLKWILNTDNKDFTCDCQFVFNTVYIYYHKGIYRIKLCK